MSEPTQPLCTSDDESVSTSKHEEREELWGELACISKNSPNLELRGKTSFTLGRGRECDFIFTHQGISGLHCKIWKEVLTVKGKQSNIYWLQDCSTNGTRVELEKLGNGTKKVITPGTTIHLLWIKKGHESNLSFIFQAGNEKPDVEEGGPHEKYVICHVLGTGNFATVKLAINKESQEKFAIKIIDKKKFSMSVASKRENALMDEVKILQRLKHPGIVSIEEVFETPTKLYIVLELVTGGELFDLVVESGQFEEPQARELFRQMLDATQYLHGQEIAHRDLKLENILIKEKGSNIVKITDFGMSRVVDSQSFMKTMCGTPQYVAPEILTSAKTKGYGKACDLWSLGVILYVMLVGYPPFNDTKSTPVYQQIKSADFDFPDEWWSGVSQEAKDLISALLVVNPSKRLTVEQALEHPWLNPNSKKKEDPAASKKRKAETKETEKKAPQTKKKKAK